MKRFKEIFRQHYKRDTRGMWFVTGKLRGKGYIEQMNDGRTKKERNRDSIIYHLTRVPINDQVASRYAKWILHQKGKRTFEYRFAPAGAILTKKFKMIKYEYDHFTNRERILKRLSWADFANRPIFKFWSEDWWKYRKRIHKKFWKEATLLYYMRKPPIYYYRANDYSVSYGYHDASRTAYLYEWKDFDWKFQYSSYLHEDWTRKWFGDVFGKRKYDKKHRRMYKYNYVRPRLFPAWSKKRITRIRKAFVKHDSHLEGHIDLDVMCQLLDEYGNRSTRKTRAAYFNHFALHHWFEEPKDKITFEEYLRILYSLTVPPRIIDPSPDPDAPVYKEKKDLQLGNYRRTEQFSCDIGRLDYYERMFGSML